MKGSGACVTTERIGHVLAIGLDRADKLNSFNLAMLAELQAAYRRLEHDEALRCGLLFGHGDHFTSGLDLAEVGPAVAAGEPLFDDRDIDPLGVFGGSVSKPVVVAVQGWCLTIGIELMLAADVRVAASDTRFAQMEVQRGIMAFGGATLRFAAQVGWGDAMRWLLTGDRFDASEALRIGLVQQVVPPGEQRARALHIAERIAAQAPLAVQATLASARAARTRAEEDAAERLLSEARRLMETSDAAEGVRSFIERRVARFQGR